MPEQIRFDHDEFESLLASTQSELEASRDTGAAERSGMEGVDPAAIEAVDKSEQEHEQQVDKGVEDAEAAKEASRAARDVGDAAASALDGSNTDADAPGGARHVGTTTDTPLRSTEIGGGSDHAPRTAAPHLAGTADHSLANLLNPNPMADGGGLAAPMQLAPQTPPPGTPVIAPPPAPDPSLYQHYTPTPATATQQDLYYAPNREELRNAIYQALNDEQATGGAGGFAGTGAPGDTRPRIHGGGSLGSFSDDESVRKFQEIMTKYVEANIPYAWGGGHGATPGLSQGVSDDGGAGDMNGDFNKIGLDCSGAVRAVWYDATGSDALAGTAADQYNMTVPVPPGEERPGDIYFPNSAGRPPQHVQMYAGNGMVFEAQQSGTNLMFSPLQDGEFRRVAA